jgi:phosphoribosyl 1,2-cyclic phosphodiesterase
VEVRLDDGTLIVLDAGTGIRKLGTKVAAEGVTTVHLLLTHLHLDHLEGLGFFAPIWNPDVELHIWGPPSPTKPLAERIAALMSPPIFPEHVADVPSRTTFHDTPEGEIVVGGARIAAQLVAHRGPTIAYRVMENGRSFAYIPDHEPARGGDLERMQPEWVSGYDIAGGADLCFHDAQYTEDEYPSHSGWGHSAVSQTVSFGLVTKVKQLVMFHHDPRHGDDQLEAMQRRAKGLWGPQDVPVLAHEGMDFELR